MLTATDFCHFLLRLCLRPGDAAVDATAGNGHDTLFLAEITGPEGRIFAFDIQPSAISATRRLLEGNDISGSRCRLIQDSHENLPLHLPPELRGCLGAVVFNLGYLPGGDKSLTTGAGSTLSALQTALDWLRPGGMAVLVLYPGHPGGAEEAQAVREAAAGLLMKDFHVSEFRTLNARRAAPVVIGIQKSSRD